MAIQLESAQIALSIDSRIKNVLDLSTTRDVVQRNLSTSFADGAGANQVDGHWSDQRQIVASSSENLDLAGGLTDAFGATITMARVKAILLEALSTNTNNVEFGGAAANAWLGFFKDASDIVSLRPGARAYLEAPDATGWVVTAGTGDILKVANSGAGSVVDYKITIWFSLS